MNKRGFTIIEIVIVIAVIGIMSMILIPKFSNVTVKASKTNDIERIKSMNTTLAVQAIEKNICDVETAKYILSTLYDNLVPQSEGCAYYWHSVENRIYLVKERTSKVIYPENTNFSQEAMHRLDYEYIKGYASINSENRRECEWVQLWRDGPKWATFNVGSTTNTYRGANEYSSETVGGYYFFGADNDKNQYYYSELTTDISETKHDTARNEWGESWRMPTFKEFEDLKNNCDVIYCDGISIQYEEGCQLSGYKFMGRGEYANNSIFIPFGGIYCNDNYPLTNTYTIECVGMTAYYWTSTPVNEERSQGFVANISGLAVNSIAKNVGVNVRAVLQE